MTEKQNLMIAMDGKMPEWTPCFWNGAQLLLSTGVKLLPEFGHPQGFDSFGVSWTATENTGWMYTPTPGVPPILSDITKWKEQLKFPDVEAINWESVADLDLKFFAIDRENKAIDYYHGNGLFERLHIFLGPQEGMEAIIEEPEAVYDLVGALVDWHIACAKKIAKYYKPDYYTFLDDYAHLRGLFMSPKMFDDLFAPHLKRLVEFIDSTPMKFKMHCCGREDLLLDNFYKIGIRRFDPCQPCCDVVGMKKRYPDIALMGGLDLQGCVDLVHVTEDELRQEVRRCIDEYGPMGGYTIYGCSVSMYDPSAFAPDQKMGIICDEAVKYGKNRNK